MTLALVQCDLDWHLCCICNREIGQPERKACRGECTRQRLRAMAKESYQSRATPTTTVCADCAKPYSTRTARNLGVCSTCRDRRGRAKRRAQIRQSFVEHVSPAYVYERDQYRCQLCDQKLRMDCAVPHPLAPTIDHVLPLSAGGTHEHANVQAAHFVCNSRKGARGGQQLALIG